MGVGGGSRRSPPPLPPPGSPNAQTILHTRIKKGTRVPHGLVTIVKMRRTRTRQKHNAARVATRVLSVPTARCAQVRIHAQVEFARVVDGTKAKENGYIKEKVDAVAPKDAVMLVCIVPVTVVVKSALKKLEA